MAGRRPSYGAQQPTGDYVVGRRDIAVEWGVAAWRGMGGGLLARDLAPSAPDGGAEEEDVSVLDVWVLFCGP